MCPPGTAWIQLVSCTSASYSCETEKKIPWQLASCQICQHDAPECYRREDSTKTVLSKEQVENKRQAGFQELLTISTAVYLTHP